jgi:hypothetical protein
MDTARLRALRTFPRVHVLLGELITNRKLIPFGSRDIRNLDALPDPLKVSLLKAERTGCAWYAWNCDSELFALAGNIDDTSSRMHAKPVLSVLLYDGKGRVIASSKWLEIQPNCWTSGD